MYIDKLEERICMSRVCLANYFLQEIRDTPKQLTHAMVKI